MRRASPIVILAVLLCSCDPIADFAETPFVQKSAGPEPRWRIDINRIRDGVFRSYAPRCLDTVRVGHTVEFRNFLPEVPANVTTLSGPETLYSPNLVEPYNYVGPDDPNNDLCSAEVDGRCVERPSWSFWRYTFEKPGAYDWLDTNQSSSGRKIVDPYYGTVTFVGLDPNSSFGTICVVDDTGGGCDGVCCSADADCDGDTRCFKNEVDAVGRCLTPSG